MIGVRLDTPTVVPDAPTRKDPLPMPTPEPTRQPAPHPMSPPREEPWPDEIIPGSCPLRSAAPWSEQLQLPSIHI